MCFSPDYLEITIVVAVPVQTHYSVVMFIFSGPLGPDIVSSQKLQNDKQRMNF